MDKREQPFGSGRLHLVPPSARPPAEEDAILVRAYQAGDSRAAALIWDRFYPLVRRVLARSLGPRCEVDDLVQETFLRLYRKLNTLREASALRAFILSIAGRVIQTELRLRWFRRWLHLFDGGDLPERPAPTPDLEAREALVRFYSLLDGLNPRQRAVFVLRHVEGMDLADVASGAGVSLATVKRWLPRLTKRIFAQAQRDPALASYLDRPTAQPVEGTVPHV